MKKILTIAAAASLALSAAQGTIVFNPAVALNVVDQGGFTGSFTPDNPYVVARIGFNFSGLNPSPLPASFVISNISLEGPGITSSLSFSDITVTGNGVVRTAFANLNSSVASLNFASSLVSFSLPGGFINDGATFLLTIQYRDSLEEQLNTSTGVFFAAQDPGPAPIPEPGTWAAAALLIGGAAFARWRKRTKLS